MPPLSVAELEGQPEQAPRMRSVTMPLSSSKPQNCTQTDNLASGHAPKMFRCNANPKNGADCTVCPVFSMVATQRKIGLPRGIPAADLNCEANDTEPAAAGCGAARKANA